MNFTSLVVNGGIFCDGDWIEKKDQDPNGAVRLIQLADIGACEFKNKSARYITEDKGAELNCTYLQKGDILIARLPDPLGRACIFPLEGKYITAVDIAIVRIPRKDINPKYVMYMINSPQFRNEIKKYESGTTRKRISRKNLDRIEFDIPPLPEQNRIVARIEELFSQLDSGLETLKKIKRQLAVYRQAVLKEAFGNSQNWEKILFKDLMSEIRNGYGAKPTDSGSNRILRISAVRAMHLNLLDFRCNDDSFGSEDTIQENDLLFTRYNGSVDFVGVCARVPELSEIYAYPDKLIKCRPKFNNEIHSKYLVYFISQGEARRYLRSKIKTTSGQNGISGSDIKKTAVYVPDIDTQRRIVSKIETRLSVCDSIEQTVDTALQQAEAMRQSILKKAFEGGLL